MEEKSELINIDLVMTYTDVLEALIMTTPKKDGQSFLELEFPYKSSYEPLNLAIIESAKEGKNSISFDFIDSDLSDIENKTLKEIQENFRRIYPSYKSWTYASYNTYDYPKYLSARGFKVEIKDSIKNHGYLTKSYYISW